MVVTERPRNPTATAPALVRFGPAAPAHWACAAVPFIDPRRANIEKFRDAYEVLIIAIIGVTSLIHVAVVGAALGWPLPIDRIAPFDVGVLFIILGNLLPRFHSNFFLGIRTPWTLSSETVWRKTHRVGGYAMVVVGLLMVVAAIIRSPQVLITMGAAAMAWEQSCTRVLWRKTHAVIDRRPS